MATNRARHSSASFPSESCWPFLAASLFGSLRETVVLVGDTAPDFEITTDSGKRITRANFGGRLLVG